MKFSILIFLGLSAIIWWISIHAFYFMGESMSYPFNNPSLELYNPIMTIMSGLLAVSLAILPTYRIENWIVHNKIHGNQRGI